MTRRMRFYQFGLILLIAVFGTGAAVSADDDTGSVRLLVGRSAIVNTQAPISRVSLTSADIADALVTSPNQLLIQGKLPGTISMFVWDRGGAMRRYDVVVERDLSQLTQHVQRLFPGESINVASNGKAIVVSGSASSKYIADKAVELAAGYVEKKEDVVNVIQVREGPPPQVLLRVRFAEVSRSALTELGASFFTGPQTYKDWDARVTTQQFPAPDWGPEGDKLVFSDFLNFFLFNTKHQLGTVIRALQSKGLFQSLAEPNLVAESGKEASFLAGGEFPIPVAQAGAANLSITVMFKEFGVRLNFTPTVLGQDRIHLKVRPEVSTLDFANAIVLQGFRIPALSTRRTETELELVNGQTFAIAGLLNNTATESLQKVPGIGDIPILGLLFRSRAAQKNRTELVVMITPEIVQRNSPGVTNEVPKLQEPYLQPLPKSAPYSPPAFTTPGWGEPEKGLPPRPASPAQPSGSADATRPKPADAAKTMSDLLPKAPALVTPETAPAAAAPSTAAPAATPQQPAPSPEARPLTKADQKRLDKAREAEQKQLAKAQEEEQKRLDKEREEQRKAEERRRRDEEKAAKAAAKKSKS